jgi:hypothetical protein
MLWKRGAAFITLVSFREPGIPKSIDQIQSRSSHQASKRRVGFPSLPRCTPCSATGHAPHCQPAQSIAPMHPGRPSLQYVAAMRFRSSADGSRRYWSPKALITAAQNRLRHFADVDSDNRDSLPYRVGTYDFSKKAQGDANLLIYCRPQRPYCVYPLLKVSAVRET